MQKQQAKKEVGTMAETTVPAKKEQSLPSTREEGRTLSPPVDIFENADGLVVVADLPGVSKADVDIRVDKDVLTIKGRPQSVLTTNPEYREYELLGFFRQFTLGEVVDQNRIKAEMKHGVLMVNLPKKEQAKPKQIKVDVTS
jgi:HSP20 family molecular chaperone IbpA